MRRLYRNCGKISPKDPAKRTKENNARFKIAFERLLILKRCSAITKNNLNNRGRVIYMQSRIKAVCSHQSVELDAVHDIREQLGLMDVRMIIYFAACDCYNQKTLAHYMDEVFGGSTIFGCSAHAGLLGGDTRVHSIVAMAFDDETISHAQVAVVKNLSKGVDVKPALNEISKYINLNDQNKTGGDKYGGIVLIDGLTAKEEIVMEQLSKQTNIVFAGGSASDALEFKGTYVYANGQAYQDAAVIAVFETHNGIDVIKTQSMFSRETGFIATKVDENSRTIFELDGEPAAVRYAEALKIPRSEVESHFFSNPFGIVHDKEIFVRSPQRCKDDAIVTYCNVKENDRLKLLQTKNIIFDTKNAVNEKMTELGEIAGLIDFRCVFRTLQLEKEGALKGYAGIFKNIPSIGFSTYGEQFKKHINQTSVMLVFK